MRYTYVLAFGALARAQGPSPPCQSVVTETAYETFYYCPCSSTTTSLSSFSTSTTASGSGQVGPGLGSGTTTSSLSSTISIAPNPPIISATATTSGEVSIAPPPLSSGGTFVVPTPPTAPTTTAGAPNPPPPSNGGQIQQIPLAGTGDYQTRALLAHNTNRRNSSIADLVWNPTMAQYAMELAMTCSYGHSNAQGDGNYGQNIGAGFTADEIPIMVTNSMYNMEINFFPAYGVDSVDLSNFSRWGHFSQILWRDTTSVGCATYDCTAAGGLRNTGAGVRPLFTVCNYFPPGNVDGQWSRVAQPQGGPTVQFV